MAHRLRSLDGLRGLAVLAVLASHAVHAAHGGFIGVDVFFVLSGYLITDQLLAEWQRAGRIDLPAFYRRRVVRLAPAFVLLLVVAVPLMRGPLAGSAAWPTAGAVIAVAMYSANWVQALNVEALGPIRHTWSLAIEEQFYLVWPLLLPVLLRRRSRLLRWLVVAASGIVLLRAAGWLTTHAMWPYFATVTHADGLVIGALVAVARRRVPTLRLVRSAGTAGVAAVVLLVLSATLRIEGAATYLVGLTLAGLAAAALVWHLVTHRASTPSRLPLAWMGRISYGIYLYHLPVFELVQAQGWGPAATASAEFGGTAALATLSWFLVERPVQRRFGRPVRPDVVVLPRDRVIDLRIPAISASRVS
ncbi:MAG: acyltransferase [Kineosporiaceae bacterium]